MSKTTIGRITFASYLNAYQWIARCGNRAPQWYQLPGTAAAQLALHLAGCPECTLHTSPALANKPE